jgi:hypothetical protein
VVKAHILHNKDTRNIPLVLFYKVVPEGLFGNAGKLTGRDNCLYIILATQTK